VLGGPGYKWRAAYSARDVTDELVDAPPGDPGAATAPDRKAGADPRRVMVVYGRDGLDEVSLGAATLVGELDDGAISEYEIHPEDYGLAMAGNRALRVETPAQSKAMLEAVLDDQPGAPRDIVIFNAGVALYAADVAGSIGEGIALAREALANGSARARMHRFVARTRELAGA